MIAAAAILETYDQLGSIKKAAKYLDIPQHKVRETLYHAGILKPGKSNTICAKCRYARADLCPFMSSELNYAEVALQNIQAKYDKTIYMYKDHRGNMRGVSLFRVKYCPKYKQGRLM